MNIWQALIHNQSSIDKGTLLSSSQPQAVSQADYERVCQKAIAYAREHLQPFVTTFQAEVLELMGALSFVQTRAFDAKQAPYEWLFADKLKQELVKLLVKEYCADKNFPQVAPLDTLVETSALAAAKLAPIRKLLKPGMGELPVEVELPQALRCHNIFVCPVNKEPCGQEDKPQLLTCGHVVSKQALERMARSERQRFKCYTCPAQQHLSEVKEILFY